VKSGCALNFKQCTFRCPLIFALFRRKEGRLGYDLGTSSIDHGCAGPCGHHNVGAIESYAIELDRNSSREPDAG
jgi:hypothetical protein